MDALIAALLAIDGWAGLHEVAAMLDVTPASAAQQLRVAVKRKIVRRRRRYGPSGPRSYCLA